MRIAIIGSNATSASQEMIGFAFQVGKLLIDQHHIIINGGMGGTMEATARGARQSNNFEKSSVIGILPVLDASLGNPYSGVVIRTDLGSARNRLIIQNSDRVLAIGGGAGTLNELSLAWELGKPIAAYTKGGGWASKLAGQRIDDRRADNITGISSLEDVTDWLSTDNL